MSEASFAVPTSAPTKDGLLFLGTLLCESVGIPQADLLFDPQQLRLVLKAPCGCVAVAPAITPLIASLMDMMSDGHGTAASAGSNGLH